MIIHNCIHNQGNWEGKIVKMTACVDLSKTKVRPSKRHYVPYKIRSVQM